MDIRRTCGAHTPVCTDYASLLCPAEALRRFLALCTVDQGLRTHRDMGGGDGCLLVDMKQSNNNGPTLVVQKVVEVHGSWLK